MTRYFCVTSLMVLFGCSSSSSTTLPDGGTLDFARAIDFAGSLLSDAASPFDSATGAATVEDTCVDTINMYRATLGLPAYAHDTSKDACADGQGKSDSMSGTAHGAFGQCGEFAQDECPGWPAPPEGMIKNCLTQMWAEGPGSDFSTHGHYINMSSSSYTMASCGFYTTPDNQVWAVQNFR